MSIEYYKHDIKSVLVIRLSSLGDILLSLSFLESLPAGIQVDWVVAQEFAFLLESHPRIRKLFKFNKAEGLSGWMKLLDQAFVQDYDAYVDLHVTIRSRFARTYLFAKAILGKSKHRKWYSISKERLRFVSALVFKKTLPAFLTPTPFWKRFAQMGAVVGGGEAIKPPSYDFFRSDSIVAAGNELLAKAKLIPKKYVCIMPASKWESKEWGVQKYSDTLKWITAHSPFQVALLGRSSDRACVALARELNEKKIPFVSFVDEPRFAVTAFILSEAHAYLGGDTGLAHLAEAVGTCAWIIFGPTRPSLGFGPWRKESRAITASVFCSPCSKDGRICYRFWEPYACLKKIEPAQVQKLLDGRNS